MLRTFIAFELPGEVVQLAGDLQVRLRALGLRLRWVRPGNMHLTVKFLGEIAPARVPDVTAAMRRTARRIGPMEVRAQGLGIFPGIRRPRILWLGLGGQTDRLAEAARLLDEALAEHGVAPERRPFRAHLTLARIKERVAVQPLLEGIRTAGGYDPIAFQLTAWVLFESDLQPRGAVYTPLARVALSPPADGDESLLTD